MSMSLVRKGLDLFKDDLLEIQDDVQHSSKKKKTPHRISSTNKQGMKKQLKKLKRNEPKNKLSVKERKIKPIIDEYKKSKLIDHTESNLAYFKTVSHRKISSETVKKVVNHERGRLAKDQELKPAAEDTGTVFTDRDFDKIDENIDGDFWSDS